MMSAGEAPAALAAGGGAGIATASASHKTSKRTRRSKRSKRAVVHRRSVPMAAVVVVPAQTGATGDSRASAASGGAGVGSGPGTPNTPQHPTVPGYVAKIVRGVAYAPANAPLAVQRAIWAGNDIRHTPYVWGGGHGSFSDTGYDCSGAVSYVLHAARLLSTPDDSSGFESWGAAGVGNWITVYTNPGHAFVQIAGIRLDTSAEGDRHPTGDPGSGPRWRPLLGDTSGFDPRYVNGY
jgi:cell wall-associated NlpC family hydrolase